MVSLARAGLLYEWRRYLAAVMALAFSALLIYIQTGLMLGFSLSMTAILNSSVADIWISDQNLKSFEWGTGIDPNLEYYLRMNPDVVSVKPFLKAHCSGQTEEGEKIWVPIFGVETDSDCLLMPPEFIEKFGTLLNEPMTIVIDRSFARNIGLAVDDYTEISSKRVKVVGITDGYKNDRGGFVFASDTTFKYLTTYRWVQYLLVKIKDPKKADQVVKDISKAMGKTGKLKIWTKDSLFWKSQKWQLLESPNSLTFIFLSLLALFIGIAITNQSLRSAILASLKEYAALRALGVSRFSLCIVILEQAFWVGVAGLVSAWIFTYIFSFIAAWYKLAFQVPLWFILISSAVLITVSLVSGLLSLMVLYKTEPADLLR